MEHHHDYLSYGRGFLGDLPCHCLSFDSLGDGSAGLAPPAELRAHPSDQPASDRLFCHSAAGRVTAMARLVRASFLAAVGAYDLLLVGLQMGRAYPPFILSFGPFPGPHADPPGKPMDRSAQSVVGEIRVTLAYRAFPWILRHLLPLYPCSWRLPLCPGALS